VKSRRAGGASGPPREPVRIRPVVLAPRLGALLCTATLLLLSGCHSLAPRAPVASLGTGAQRAYLQQLDGFSLSGRVAGAVGKEGFNAQLDLQQHGTQSRLVLRSPLGFGSATVQTDGRTLEFRSSRGERLTGEAGLQALSNRLGFEPPVQSLRYWLLGVPDPAVPAVEQVPTADSPHTFEQRGWQVTATELAPTPTSKGAVEVPRRVTIERATARLRVVVDKWQLD
jgi:outer membrane lipoprotein LolB